MTRLLLASIHDVGPRFESEIDQLVDLLGGILGEARFALLAVPHHWGGAPLTEAKAFQAKLRQWSDLGAEVFTHGWFHKDSADHSGMTGFKARHMTASEGEFLGLSQAEAARRMADGRKLIEDITGKAPAGFIAPAWLYGPGAMAALQASGFALAEDHFKVWRATDGAVLARGPVVTWASRSRGRQLSSRMVAGLARSTFHGMPVARIAVHPGDTGVPALINSITKTLSSFARKRRVGRYADLHSSGVIPNPDS